MTSCWLPAAIQTYQTACSRTARWRSRMRTTRTVAPVPGWFPEIRWWRCTSLQNRLWLQALKSFYNSQYQVAEHISAPLAEEAKVTLKVSQNLHASMTPYILGAIVGKATAKIDQKGFALEHEFLTKAGLDLSGASQADGAGGAASAFYTPDFMVRYLAYMASQPIYPIFERALPILGRDGTLVNIQHDSPAAGHVFAKTGTFDSFDLLNMQNMLEGKGLAGYTTTPSGQHLAFALYVNHVELPDDPDATDVIAGEALGAIATAVYALPIDKSALDAH